VDQARGGQGGRGGNSGNGRGGPGGAGGNGAGGGLWAESSLAAPFLVNCTVYGNEAHYGRGGDGGIGTGWPNGATGVRGLGQGGGLHASGGPGFVPRVYFCTVTANFADGRLGTVGGGGVEGRAECRSTLIAGNFASDAVIGAPDCAGDFAGSAYNLVGIGDGSAGFTIPANQVGSLSLPLDARLGLLGYYGGPIPVLPLLSDSPARDRGHSSGVTNDQRGTARPVDWPELANAVGGDGSDIGACEYGGTRLITNLADNGLGSLQQFVGEAAAGDTGLFAPGLTGTVALASGEIAIDRD
jgi:hypothetical protein